MDLSLRLSILLLGILLTGLTAGLCFTWSNAITPGIGRLDDLGFLKAFQSMNRVIINGRFLLVFFGPVVLLFLNAYLFKNGGFSFWLFLLAAILFFVGLALVTIFGNVPLNELLDKSVLESLSQEQLEILRERFEQPWNRWHMVRTICSILSFALLLLGMVYLK